MLNRVCASPLPPPPPLPSLLPFTFPIKWVEEEVVFALFLFQKEMPITTKAKQNKAKQENKGTDKVSWYDKKDVSYGTIKKDVSYGTIKKGCKIR